MKFLSNVFLLCALGLSISVAYFTGHGLETHQGKFFLLAGIDLVLAAICFSLAIRIGRSRFPEEGTSQGH